MKKSICCLIITILVTLTSVGQSGIHTQTFNGNLEGASLSGTIKFRADCYLGNPYVSVVIGNIKITSYTYQGRRYSGSDIPGYVFPVNVKGDYLNIKASFKYGINSVLQTKSTQISINGSVSGGLSSAYFDDKFNWEDESRVREIIKSHGIKSCSDNWGQKLGNALSISITGGGLGSVNRELENAIKILLKNNKVDDLLDQANNEFFDLNYDEAERLYNEVRKEDYNNNTAKNRLEEIKRKREDKKLEENFDALIESGLNYYEKQDYKSAIQEYKKALSTGYNDDKAQNKIWEAESAEEKLNKLKEKEESTRLEKEKLAEGEVEKMEAELEKINAAKEEEQKRKREEKKEEDEFKEKKRKADAEKDAEISRKIREGAQQQSSIDAQINAVKKAGDYLTSSMDLMFQQNASYNNYKSKIESATRMQKSDDPDEIIRQFNYKLEELERLSQQRYNQVVKEINASYAQQSSYNSTSMEQLGTDIGTAIVKMSLPNQIAKEKAANIKKLEDDKRKMLTKVKNDLVKDFKKNKENFFRRAASEISADKEKYYLNMSKYYQCKIDKTESRFSIDNTNWVDPNCDMVKENFLVSNDNPSDKQLYEASLRKYKNSNAYYQIASKDFVEMAIKANPKKADYFFHRAKFEELGSKLHINFLIKTLELNKAYPNAKKLLSESLAEKKRIDETTFFDANWKVTSRKHAAYYRPLVDMVNGLYHVKDYYSSNNQLQMEGFATKIDDNSKATFNGKVIYYYENGKINNETFFDNGILKQVINHNKEGFISIAFYDGSNKNIFINKNYGVVEEIKYSKNGFIKYIKWNYTRSYKKKYYEFYSFTFDENGNLLFRDIYSDNGVLKDRIVEDNIEAMHSAALSYIDEGQSNQAIKFLENSIVLYPNDALMYYYLATAKSKKENLFTSINNGISKNLNVSLSNKISKNDEEAIKYFNEGVNYAKGNSELLLLFYKGLGEIYFKVNDFEKSEDAYNQALNIMPKNPSLLNSYSKTLATSVQKLDKAEQMIKLCNEIESNNYNYLDTYSWVLYKQGRYKEAENLNDRAIRYGGDAQAIIWEHKGDIWYKLGEKGNALLHWKKAKTINKENGGEVSVYLNQKIKKEILLE